MIRCPQETKGHPAVPKQTLLRIDTSVWKAIVMDRYIIKTCLNIHSREDSRIGQLVAQGSLVWDGIPVLLCIGVQRDKVHAQPIILPRLLTFY